MGYGSGSDSGFGYWLFPRPRRPYP
ncbi:hypothetical protein STRTUCAR8_01150, partial [Streptomyces turgidiscabies Car8]